MRYGFGTTRIGTGMLLLLVMSSAANLAGAETLISELGVRGGVSDNKNSDDFSLVEVFARGLLPWSWSLGDQWLLHSYLEAGLGALEGGGTTGMVASVGPLAVLSRADSVWRFEAGFKPTWLSESRFGRTHLGGHFHFTSHIGVSYAVSQQLRLGYRFQHTSNGGIAKANPGLNLHLLTLGWSFD